VTAQRELEQQLVQARKSEALGQLTGGVAHDFNNLLAAVLGGLRLLEARIKLGQREQQILEHMRHAAESGAELVRRLMAFARKQDLTPTAVAPRELCKSVSGLVEHTLGGLVTVEWEVRETDLQLFVDSAQLELALVNLLINARDAMPDGGTIRVDIDEVTASEPGEPGEPREYLQIRVRDEGGGIPPDLLERVTEPFFTTKAAGKGTGLGLSMVAGFVEQSGGTFRLKSEAGRGTEVTMILPATRAARKVANGNDPDHAAEIAIGSIMVVDDDESVREIVSEQLREMGLEVTVAADGDNALAALEANGQEPDFVLTDFSMPGLDGMALLTAIRERWPQIRGAIMTGNPQESLVRCDPSFAIIHKPIDPTELKRLLADG
jgi:CheY-like chemotaxis protein